MLGRIVEVVFHIFNILLRFIYFSSTHEQQGMIRM